MNCSVARFCFRLPSAQQRIVPWKHHRKLYSTANHNASEDVNQRHNRQSKVKEIDERLLTERQFLEQKLFELNQIRQRLKPREVSEVEKNITILALVVLLVFFLLKALRTYGDKENVSEQIRSDESALRTRVESFEADLDYEDILRQVDTIMTKVSSVTNFTSTKDQLTDKQLRKEIEEILIFGRSPEHIQELQRTATT